MEGTYEYELERAELLGIEPPNREQWEEQTKARREAELEQKQSEVAQALEAEDETLKGGHGKMDELNNILSATQLKINKFKVNELFCSKTIVNKQIKNFSDGLWQLHEFVENKICKSGAI